MGGGKAPKEYLEEKKMEEIKRHKQRTLLLIAKHNSSADTDYQDDLNLGEEYNELNIRGKDIYFRGFQKGKLEQKKEELRFLLEIKGELSSLVATKQLFLSGYNKLIFIQARIKQLQKEIGGKE